MKKYFIIFFFCVFIFGGCSPKESAASPKVKTFFELDKSGDNKGFISGFNIKLAWIESDRPGAGKINSLFEKEAAYWQNYIKKAGNFNKSNERVEVDYKAYEHENIMTIVTKGYCGWKDSEYSVYYKCYYYDFVNDQVLDKNVIVENYHLDETQILDYIKNEKGIVVNPSSLSYYKNSAGELFVIYTNEGYVDSQEIIDLPDLNK